MIDPRFFFCALFAIGRRYAAPEAFRHFLFPLQVLGDGKAGWKSFLYFYRCIISTLSYCSSLLVYALVAFK